MPTYVGRQHEHEHEHERKHDVADGISRSRAPSRTGPLSSSVRTQVWDLYCPRANQRSHLLRMLARIWQSSFQMELKVNHVK